MVRILAADGMEASAIEELQSLGFEVVEQYYEPDALGGALKEFDVVVVRSKTKVREAHIDQALETGRLRLIIRGGVGVDNIDVAYARSKGIQVSNTPTASCASVAELAIGHMFCLARYLYISNVTMREGKWEKKHYEGIELAGKTLGLIGCGGIGSRTGEKAAALGMNVVYTNRRGSAVEGIPFRYVPMDELLAASDFISLHMPKADRPVITAAEIEKMKDGAFIINTSRGALIDEDDLLAALDTGKLGGAALDVFVEEPTKNERLYTHPKISLTPHIGGSTAEAQERIGEEVVSIIKAKFA